MKNWFKQDGVEFFCHPEDVGVIPEPYPARKLIPSWYKSLAPRKENRLERSTIKRCAPFLDAMTAGWIIPLAADVEFFKREDGGHQSGSKFYKPMVEMHTASQVAGHPSLNNSFAWKWINHWFIKIPKDTKALFVPPLNRSVDLPFECVTGAVDCEYMGHGDMEVINFPFFFKQSNYVGTIKQGTPMVQMIIIPRDSLEIKGKVRPMTEADYNLNQLTKRRLHAHESHYRDNLWKPKS